MIKKLKKKFNRISEHFTRNEFKCKCGCGQCIINDDLVRMLETIRHRTAKPVIVHCVNRCREHNKAIGGVDNSQHVLGKAADIHIKGMSIKDLHDYAENNHGEFLTGGLGLYDWGIHIDSGAFRKWEG